MKRLLLGIALLLLPMVAVAQPHEALLTPDGTLFTLDAYVASEIPDLHADADTVLVLRSRHGEELSTEIVPATLSRGRHASPAMAYEADSGMLFVFWIRHRGIMFNELVFASRDRNGVWSEATTFGDPYDFRENLRIAVTRRIETTDEEGETILIPGVTVHAAWWEFDSISGEESAQYAMLSVENGSVASVEYLDLATFVAEDVQRDELEIESLLSGPPGGEGAATLLKQPLLFPSIKQDSVVVVFGDQRKRDITQVRVNPTKPIASDGRLRVPIGRREGGSGSPKLDVGANARIDGLYGDTDRLALYTRDGNAFRYVVLRDGKWSAPKRIVLDERITSAAAVDALRRLLSEH